jgi:hypothetical protein
VRLQVADPRSHPDFLDLPWEQPLVEWTCDRFVPIEDGMHRHVVRFVAYETDIYVLKELPHRLAEREYTVLRHLAQVGIPCVTAVGVASERGAATHGEAVLITRYLDFSLPYRVLVGDRRIPYLGDRLLDALAGLLVRIHLAGVFWGDCSLGNTLFRRDAGALTAYVIDLETAEMHAKLTDGQRGIDLDIATENMAGGLLDLQAAGRLPDEIDPWEMADRVRAGYDHLFTEVTRDEVFAPDETYRIDARVARLNDLGFDVEELELTRTDAGDRVRLVPRVVELGYHAPRLQALTGLVTQENQARRLLNDIRRFRARLEKQQARTVPETVAAARWLDQVFDPVLGKIPPELREKLEPAEIFHQVLEHRWFLSEAQGMDVGMDPSIRSYVANVLSFAPDERRVFSDDGLSD